MKKIIMILFSFLLIMWGCSKKDWFEITFDNFKITFETQNSFKREELSAKGIGFQIVWNDIIKTYKQTNNTWYIDSIIILKKLANKDLKDFVDENLDKLRLQWYKILGTKESKINCNNERVDTYTINAKLDLNLEPIFFSHTIFIHNKQIYIISYSTEIENEQKSFSNSLGKIKCKK